MQSEAKAKWLSENPILLKAGDVSRLLGVHSQTVYRMASKNVFPSLKMGKSRRFLAADILEYIEKSGEDY
jgi:excisionase family DNA binding protein